MGICAGGIGQPISLPRPGQSALSGAAPVPAAFGTTKRDGIKVPVRSLGRAISRGRVYTDAPFVAASAVGTTPSIRYPEGVFDPRESSLDVMFKFLRFLVIANKSRSAHTSNLEITGPPTFMERPNELTLRIRSPQSCEKGRRGRRSPTSQPRRQLNT